VQAPQDDSQTRRLLRANTSFHAVLEKPLQPPVPKAPDHGPECNPRRYALQAAEPASRYYGTSSSILARTSAPSISSRATAIGSLKRRGPALPGFT